MITRAPRTLTGAVALVLGACAPLLPLPAPPATAPPATDVPVAAPAASALELEVHQRINRFRASRGLPALHFDSRVAQLARDHSERMASGERPFSHDGFAQRADAVRAAFAIAAIAENVAYNNGPEVAARLAEQWIASPGHLENIVGRYDVTGIGVARSSNGVYYATQIFALRR